MISVEMFGLKIVHSNWDEDGNLTIPKAQYDLMCDAQKEHLELTRQSYIAMIKKNGKINVTTIDKECHENTGNAAGKCRTDEQNNAQRD